MRAERRLKRLERLRPKSWVGFKRIILEAPESSFDESGEPCREHADCRVEIMGPLEAHFQLAKPPPGALA